jgi:hypothetical protein
MTTNRSAPPASVTAVLTYADVREAVDWLTGVFGFAERVRIGDHRAQLSFGDGALIVADDSGDRQGPLREGAGGRSRGVQCACGHAIRRTAVHSHRLGWAPLDVHAVPQRCGARRLGRREHSVLVTQRTGCAVSRVYRPALYPPLVSAVVAMPALLDRMARLDRWSAHEPVRPSLPRADRGVTAWFAGRPR